MRRMRGTVVTDLDMTIFDCRHRQHLERAGEFDEFHARCKGDAIFPDVANLLRYLSPDWLVIGVTGRPKKYATITTKLLHREELWLDHLLMRPEHNYQRQEDLKISLLEGFYGSKEAVLENVSFVLEDKEKVVEAYRNYGLSTWQVR